MSKKFMIIRSKSTEAYFFTNEKLLEISRSGKQVALLSNDFYGITHLSWWYIDRMTDEEIDENIITRIFPSFVNVMPNLVHLDVDKMFEWHEQEIVMAPTNVDFQYLGGLTHLSMACNYLREVPKDLSLLVNLDYLDISNNLFDLCDLNFSGMTKLTRLFINGGETSGMMDEQPIHDSICLLVNLRELSFDMTKLLRLPDGIGNLVNLTCLSVDGSCLNELPDSIAQLTNLVELMAYGNAFEKLPENFGDLNSLEMLGLKANCDILTLPKSFIQLTQLKDLGLPGHESFVRPEGYAEFYINLEKSGCLYEESDM